MKRSWPIVALLPSLAACGSLNMMEAAQSGGATYEVTLTPMWSAQSHPLDYPKAGLLTGPHFSGLIGATHAHGFTLFAEGRLPTTGLERLSEEGKHSPLDAEIKAAIRSGNAGELVESDALKDFSMTASATVHVTDAFPKVSLVAMVAPSPDWFLGVSGVELRAAGTWVSEKELLVYAYDSGGDAGTTYEAPDADLDPKRPTKLNDAPHFLRGGTRVPVARLTFRRK